ncbi:NYN domain-containing protein [Porcipelethomonas sp.]|uniref:NYN domain-containing protein n=1 Tax=Porcipelethomonas sp. TaxID=2981675 RepID=UPI003EF6C69C
MKKLVTGILAHVDSGKTTLSEGILYKTGEIRKWGRVDHRDTFLDTHFLERERGITIFSKQAVFHINDSEFTLLDTPGHADFSAEAERTLQVLDYAILIISGSEGVQSHTETLWNLLKKYSIPVFVFINKMDISTLSHSELIQEITDRLGNGFVDFSVSRNSEEFFENIALCDENIMQEFLNTSSVSDELVRSAVFNRKIFPCCFGSALKLDGIEELLNILDLYTQNIEYGNEFSAKVFKISEDEQKKRLTHMKITGGSIKVRDLIKYGCGKNIREEKINQIRIYSGNKYTTAEEVSAGTVCAVTGLTCAYPGEGLGQESDSDYPVMEPILSYSVVLPPEIDNHTGLKDLKLLEEEDPQLHVIWNERLGEIQIQLMGEIQLEILKDLIFQRFGYNAEFGHSSIAYKETIASPVEGVGHYEPLRHYAEVHLLLEPGQPGSGLVFESDCNEDILDKNWQRLILTHLQEKQHIGVLTGSPITDMKITLIGGRAHIKHTEGGDFRQATYRAVRHGLKCTESILLEPWYKFRLEIPSETAGRAISDIQRMNGKFSPPETSGDMSVIDGEAPVYEIRDYQSEVNAYTKGRGRLNCSLKGYEPCHNADDIISEIGYNSDSDVANTADSVFCSHGAGYVVKWNEVYDKMHLERFFKPVSEITENESVVRQVKRYQNRLAEDQELMEIFERTYGPVRRDVKNAFRSVRKNSMDNDVSKYKAPPVPKGPEYLLVDGYNIIFAWDNLSKLAKDSLDAARNRLIDILCNYQGFKQCELILVFDAYKIKGGTRSVEKVHNISVVYTKEAETADMYIEKVTHEIGRNHRVRVATSDNLEQIIILGNGACRISASEFQKEVEETENIIRDYIM